VEDAQRSALRRAALTALVRQHRTDATGGAELDVHDVGFGAAVASEGRALVFVDDSPERALGPALLWAERAGARQVEVWASVGAGHLARRAGYFTDPPTVLSVSGRELVPATPAPVPAVDPIAPEAAALRSVLIEAGVTVVDDHGVLVGEFEGLEVARVVAVGGEAWIEVGVGHADRQFDEAFHGRHSTVQRIRRVVDVVRGHRVPGATPHPLNRMGRSRWLRSKLLADPGLVGAAALEPAPPLRPRSGLLQDLPAAATGVDPDGAPVVVVASVGIDLDLVPEAADLRDRHDPDARLVLVLAPRDRIPPVDRLLARVRGRNEVRVVEPPWHAG
jgi:hypothetical protein